MTQEENLCNYDEQEQIPQDRSLITLSPEKIQTVLIFLILTTISTIKIRKLKLLQYPVNSIHVNFDPRIYIPKNLSQNISHESNAF